MKHLTVLFFFVTNNFASFSQSYCTLVDSILHIPEIKILLELDSLKDKNPIRVISLDKSISNCMNLYKVKNQFIQYSTIQTIPFDLNAGNCRDLIISKLSCTKKEIVVDVYLSNYRWRSNSKSKWHFTVFFKIDKQHFFVKKIEYAEWD